MSELPEKIRAFISIEVAPKIIQALTRLQSDLDAAVPKESVRWTGPEQMHLTLRFLGNIEAGAVGAIEAAMREPCEHCDPLQLRAEGLGGFPSLRSPRVIWVGLQGDLALLQQLQSQIEEVTRRWGEPPEKRGFHPHLTLGRVREKAARHARRIGEILQAAPVPAFGEWPVKEVRLMRSKLSPKGAQYSCLAAVPLGTKGGDRNRARS